MKMMAVFLLLFWFSGRRTPAVVALGKYDVPLHLSWSSRNGSRSKTIKGVDFSQQSRGVPVVRFCWQNIRSVHDKSWKKNARALRSAEIQLIVLEAKLAVGPFAEEISVLQEKGNITNTSQIFFQLHIFIRLV
jgi:hypothetical protein